MDTVRTSKAVLRRLKDVYGDTKGRLLYGFWSCLCQQGEEVTRREYPKTTYWRHRKELEGAGVSWRGSDVVVVANDGLLPADFAPVRSDKRLCYLPARNREEYRMSRDLLPLAA